MRVEDLVATYPLVCHMAEAGAWDSICKLGLLSTSALLDLYQVPPEIRYPIECEPRKESVVLRHDGLPDVVIRDQKVLRESTLRKVLIDMTPGEWCRLLNSKVFFWVDEARLDRLLIGKPYRDRAHDVITIDTAELVRLYCPRISLTPYVSVR